ncbi:uncharacterized protein LOC100182695 isoform X2 [Ciona intestinalis]
MTVQPDIYWSRATDESTDNLSFVPGVDLRNRSVNIKPEPRKKSISSSKKKPEKLAVRPPFDSKVCCLSKIKGKEIEAKDDEIPSSSKLASLRDLCPEDKERIANLVKELAKASNEKQESETKLGEERKRFHQQLKELKEDKKQIENEQINVLKQYRECQTLLSHYQEQINQQQKDVASDIHKLLTTAPLISSNATSSESKSTPTSTCELPHHVRQLSNEITPQQHSHDNSFGKSLKVSHQTETSYDPMSLKRSSYDRNHMEDHWNQSHISPSTIEDTETYVQNMTSAFEEKVEKLSPRGRREALMQQKFALEKEQIRLQQMLSEQEKILRLRQSELKKTHNEYSTKIRSFNNASSNVSPSATYDGSTDVYSIRKNDEMPPPVITPVIPMYNKSLNKSSYSMSEYDISSHGPDHMYHHHDCSSSKKCSPPEKSWSGSNREM